MDSKFKQNDIFVASINKPDATLFDLYKNDINAENTQFLPMDAYKLTPFVLKKYTMDGVFDEERFNNDYINASKKWLELTDDEAINNLKKEIEYSPTSIYAPIDSKKYNTSVSYEKLRNPGKQAIGLSQINKMEEQTKTNEELALMNRIWDTEKQEWMKETPETLNIFKKVFGNTLNYAIWEEDGYDDNGEFHRQGEWKTDKDGNYYTETLGNRLLGNKQVVKLEDILTKEDTLLNKYDFLDSDGYEKSVTGTIAKTALSIAPYLVPWLKINKIYGGVATILGLGEALPSFYKNIEALLTGDTDSSLGKAATSAENWFKKFEHSISKEGQEGFMSLESIGTMVSDVFSQIYQQRNMASLSKLFIPDEAVAADKTFKTALKRNKLSQDLALGYMALVSASDTYNDALNSNYDPRSAGLAGLLTAGSLYGIMGFNESTRGLGTWFLDKTTGYSEDVSRKAFSKPIKELWKSYGDDLKTFIDQGDKKGIRNTLSNFKEKVKLKAYDILNDTEGIWTKAVVEGVEEVSEEAVQDAVKGMMDTLSWLGFTQSKGSFGGFKNVFSVEGLKRYMTSLLGGALGGALFDVQSKYINPWVNGEEINKHVDKKSITQLILEGKEDLLLEEVDRYKNIFNLKTSPMVMNVNGEMVAMPVQNNGKTQADLIADAVKREIYETKFNIEQELGPMKDIMVQLNSMGLGDKLDPIMKTFNEGVRKEFSDIATNIVQTKDLIKEITDLLNGDSSKNLTDEKKLELNKNLEYKTNKLKRLVNKANSFFGGENVSRNVIKFQLFRNKQLRDSFALTYDPNDPDGNSKIFALDLDSYAYNKYKVIYNELDDPEFKEQIKAEWEMIKDNTSDEDIISVLNLLSDLYIEESKSLTPYLKEFENNSNKRKYWMQTINLFDENFNMGENPIIYKNEETKDDALTEAGINSIAKIKSVLKNFKSFTLRDLKNIDIASILFDLGIVELQKNQVLDDNNKIVVDPLYDKKLNIVKQIINQQAARLNIKSGWDADMLAILFDNVRDILNTKPRSNIYINKLYDLYSDQDLSFDEITENLDFTLNDNLSNFSKNIIALENLNKQTSREILKYIDQSEYISKDIYDHLNTEIDNYVNRTFNRLIKSSLDSQTIDKSDVSVLSNSDNKYDILKYFFSENEDLNLIKNFDKDIQRVLSDIRQNVMLYNAQDILEFQHYDSIKDKLNTIKIIDENPIYSLIKNVFRKFTYNQKQMDIFDYLLTKELEINSLQSQQLLKYKDDEKEEVVNMLIKTLKHLSGLIEGSTNFNGESSLTDKIKEFQKEFYNEDVSEKYYSINEESRLDINNILNSLLGKLITIDNLYNANLRLTEELDKERDYKINRMLIDFYKEPLMIGDKVVIDEKKFDENIDDIDTWILEREIEIHKAFNNPDNSDEDNQKLKEEFISDFISNSTDSWNNIYNINDIIYTYGSDGKQILRNKIHDGFALQKILSLMNVNPLELDKKYIESLNKNPKLVRTSYQELVFKIAYSQINNSESKKLSNFALKLLHEKLQEAITKDNTIFNNQFCKGLLFMNGAAGCGKSTAGAKMLNEARPADITLVAAPTVSKAQDFGLTINNDKNSGLIVWGGNNSLMSNLYENSDKLFEFRNKFLEYLNTTLGEELKNQKDGDFTYEFTYDGITAKIQINKSGNYSSAKDFKFEGLDNLTLLNSDKTINVFVDEATLLDPFSIALLSNYGEKVENSMVVLLGDSLQNGFIYKINNITNKWGINEYFTLRTPYMTNMFRANNTGVLDNCTLLKNVASICNHPYKQIVIKEQTYIDLLDIFDLNKLKYKIDSQNNKLYGHEITNNNSVLKERLSLILNDIKDTDEKLSILLPELENPNINIEDTDEYKEITTLLGTLGYTNKNFEIYSENHLNRGIQGSESKYVLLYDLKANSDLDSSRNYDTDTLSIYTYASRPKDYELIFEKDSSKGLFGFYHIESNPSDINIISNVDENAKEISKKYIENRIKLLNSFGAGIENSNSSKNDSGTKEGDGEDDEEGGNNNPNPKNPSENKNNKEPEASLNSINSIPKSDETELNSDNKENDREEKEDQNNIKSKSDDSPLAQVILKSPFRYSFNKYHKQLDSTGNLQIDDQGNLIIPSNYDISTIYDTDYPAYIHLFEDTTVNDIYNIMKQKSNLKNFSKFIDLLYYNILNFALEKNDDGTFKIFQINGKFFRLKSLSLFRNPDNAINPFDKPFDDPNFENKSSRLVLQCEITELDKNGNIVKNINGFDNNFKFTLGAIRNIKNHEDGLALFRLIPPTHSVPLDINKLASFKSFNNDEFLLEIIKVNSAAANKQIIAKFLIAVTNLRQYRIDKRHRIGLSPIHDKNYITLNEFQDLSNLTLIEGSDRIFRKEESKQFFEFYNKYRLYPLNNKEKELFEKYFYNKRWVLFGFCKKNNARSNTENDYEYVIPIALDKRVNFKQNPNCKMYHLTMFLNSLNEIVGTKNDKNIVDKINFNNYYTYDRNAKKIIITDENYTKLKNRLEQLKSNSNNFFKNSKDKNIISNYIDAFLNYIKDDSYDNLLKLKGIYNSPKMDTVFNILNQKNPYFVIEYETPEITNGKLKKINYNSKDSQYCVNYVYEDPLFVLDLENLLSEDIVKEIKKLTSKPKRRKVNNTTKLTDEEAWFKLENIIINILNQRFNDQGDANLIYNIFKSQLSKEKFLLAKQLIEENKDEQYIYDLIMPLNLPMLIINDINKTEKIENIIVNYLKSKNYDDVTIKQILNEVTDSINTEELNEINLLIDNNSSEDVILNKLKLKINEIELKYNNSNNTPNTSLTQEKIDNKFNELFGNGKLDKLYNHFDNERDNETFQDFINNNFINITDVYMEPIKEKLFSMIQHNFQINFENYELFEELKKYLDYTCPPPF